MQQKQKPTWIFLFKYNRNHTKDETGRAGIKGEFGEHAMFFASF